MTILLPVSDNGLLNDDDKEVIHYSQAARPPQELVRAAKCITLSCCMEDIVPQFWEQGMKMTTLRKPAQISPARVSLPLSLTSLENAAGVTKIRLLFHSPILMLFAARLLKDVKVLFVFLLHVIILQIIACN